MSPDENNPNRTVFRPSPLQGLKGGAQGKPPEPAPGFGAPAGFGAPPSFGGPPPAAPPQAPYSPAPMAGPGGLGQAISDGDIPEPGLKSQRRNVMMEEAAPFLALAASVRSGRAQIGLPQLHRQVSQAIANFDRAIQQAGYPEEQRQRAKYAVCATIDDIAQNLPNQASDAAEWARRSMVVQFFSENIGGDRFWQLLDDMLAKPAQFADLIELYHACLAAGFEGRFRIASDGKRRLHEIMSRAYAALEHPRTLSQLEVAPHWKGQPAPVAKVGFWAPVLLAGAIAAGVLLLAYILFRVLLAQTGQPSLQALKDINPTQPLRLSRAAPKPPPVPAGAQQMRLKTFLAPEIAQHLVVVEQDPATVRVRTTVGQLFKSGSDQLEPGRQALFERIGQAVETEKGYVHIEGHADSDKLSGSVAFPDNFALSKARADTVAGIIKSKLSDGSRVTSKGYGDSQPIASNATSEGKALNRRVEIVIPRNQ